MKKTLCICSILPIHCRSYYSTIDLFLHLNIEYGFHPGTCSRVNSDSTAYTKHYNLSLLQLHIVHIILCMDHVILDMHLTSAYLNICYIDLNSRLHLYPFVLKDQQCKPQPFRYIIITSELPVCQLPTYLFLKLIQNLLKLTTPHPTKSNKFDQPRTVRLSTQCPQALMPTCRENIRNSLSPHRHYPPGNF